MGVDSMDLSKGKIGDQKVFFFGCSFVNLYPGIWHLGLGVTLFSFLLCLFQALRRLAQNREAARKSRMRKKVNLYKNLLFDDIKQILNTVIV